MAQQTLQYKRCMPFARAVVRQYPRLASLPPLSPWLGDDQNQEAEPREQPAEPDRGTNPAPSQSSSPSSPKLKTQLTYRQWKEEETWTIITAAFFNAEQQLDSFSGLTVLELWWRQTQLIIVWIFLCNAEKKMASFHATLKEDDERYDELDHMFYLCRWLLQECKEAVEKQQIRCEVNRLMVTIW
ncbi:hypothetical protein ACOMHN_035280 [Nucella lapillus]